VGRAGPKTQFEDRVSDPDSTKGALEDPMYSPLSRIASPMGQGNCDALPGTSGTALRCAGLRQRRDAMAPSFRAAAGPQRQCPIVRRSPDKMTGNDRALRPFAPRGSSPHCPLWRSLYLIDWTDSGCACCSATASSGAPLWTRGAFHRCRNRRGRGGLR
jgi:hypothetical protein